MRCRGPIFDLEAHPWVGDRNTLCHKFKHILLVEQAARPHILFLVTCFELDTGDSADKTLTPPPLYKFIFWRTT